MQNIYVLLTGGTIGSSVHDGIISAVQSGCTALKVYKNRYSDDTDFHTKHILNILSENLAPAHWEIIVNHLLSEDLSGYDGVMIFHGSDTLSYTSAFLGIALSSLKIPVVITASDLVPDDPESNAAENIRASVLCIRRFSRGIFAVYKNKSDDYTSVYLSTRLKEADRVFGNFSSFDGVPFTKVKNDSITLCGKVSENTLTAFSGFRPPLPLSLRNRVLLVRQYPGIRLSDIILDNETKAVLVITFHSSSASAEGDDSVLGLLRRCNEKGVRLFLASFDKNKKAVYETSDILLKNGAVPLNHISDEAAYAKLMLWAALDEKEQERFLGKSCFFEYL